MDSSPIPASSITKIAKKNNNIKNGEKLLVDGGGGGVGDAVHIENADVVCEATTTTTNNNATTSVLEEIAVPADVAVKG